MRKFVRKHSGAIQVAALVAGTVGLAVYVHAVDSSKSHGGDLLSGVTELGAWNLTLLVPIGLLALYEVARRVEGHASREDTTRSVSRIIEAMVRGYVFPKNWSENSFRAYCHQVDRKRKLLKPVAVASPIPGVDERTPLPLSGDEAFGLVVAEALQNRMEVCREVNPPPTELRIWSSVKTVIAVPVLDVDDPAIALGTISVDTSLPLSATEFNDPNTAAVLVNVAKAVALLWRAL